MEQKNPVSVVDAIIEKDGKVVLIQRGKEPFKGRLALPGGHVKYREMVEDAVVREIKEETGLEIEPLEILGVYSDPQRDPRDPNRIDTVFIAKLISGEPKADSDAKEAGFFDPEKLKKEELAFDHFQIIGDYLKYKKQKRTYWSTRR